MRILGFLFFSLFGGRREYVDKIAERIVAKCNGGDVGPR